MPFGRKDLLTEIPFPIAATFVTAIRQTSGHAHMWTSFSTPNSRVTRETTTPALPPRVVRLSRTVCWPLHWPFHRSTLLSATVDEYYKKLAV